MAVTAKAAGGKWSVKTTWEPEEVPGSTTDVILGAGSGNVEISAAAKCRSLEASAYTKTLTFSSAEPKLSIGGTSTPGFVFKFSEAMGLSFTGEPNIEVNGNKVEEEEIVTGKKTLPNLIIDAGGKIKFGDDVTCKLFSLELGTVLTNNKNLTCTRFYLGSDLKKRAINLGSSKVVITETSAAAEQSFFCDGISKLTFEPETSTIEVSNSERLQKKIELKELKIPVLILSGNNFVLKEIVPETLELTLAKKPEEIKATLVESSKTLTVTSGTLPGVNYEVVGASIPTGTVVTKTISVPSKTVEMSAAATSTVAVAEAVESIPAGLVLTQGETFKVTTFSENGKTGELVDIRSTESGKTAKLSKTSGSVVASYLRIRDNTAEGGASWRAKNSTLTSNVVGWATGFEPQEYTAELKPKGKSTKPLVSVVDLLKKAEVKPKGTSAKKIPQELVQAVLKPVGHLTRGTLYTLKVAKLNFEKTLERFLVYKFKGELKFTKTLIRKISYTFKGLGGLYPGEGVYPEEGLFPGEEEGSGPSLKFHGKAAKGIPSFITGSELTFTKTFRRSISYFTKQAKLKPEGTLQRKSVFAFLAELFPRIPDLIPMKIPFTIGGSPASAGSLVRKTSFIISKKLKFEGAVEFPAVLKTVVLNALLSFTGIINRHTTNIRETAELTFVGELPQKTSASLKGLLSFAGSITTPFQKGLNALLKPVGAVHRSTVYSVVGSTVSFTGFVFKNVPTVFQAAIKPKGKLTKALDYFLRKGNLTFTGQGLKFFVSQEFNSILSFVGSAPREIKRSLKLSELFFVGEFEALRTAEISFNSVLNFEGFFERFPIKNFLAEITPKSIFNRFFPVNFRSMLKFKGLTLHEKPQELSLVITEELASLLVILEPGEKSK